MVMAMAMAMIIPIIQKMIDIHTHFMYGVDDGSKNIQMTEELLSMSSSQGVSAVFLTPHISSQLTDQELTKYQDKFNEISNLAKSFGIKCYLGAEIYIPFRIPNIDFTKHLMGQSKVLLVEFSTYLETPVLDHTFNLIKKGFKIIIAHVERYEYLSMNDLINLKEMGVFLQVNASSIIKKGRSRHLKRAWKYIKNELVDFIASDSHNTTSRQPNLGVAYKILQKKIGQKKLENLFINNALNLLIKN